MSKAVGQLPEMGAATEVTESKLGIHALGRDRGDGFDVIEEHSPCGRDFSFECTFGWSLLLLVAQCAVQRNTLSTKHVVVRSNGSGKT
jgi:hypothetical protein